MVLSKTDVETRILAACKAAEVIEKPNFAGLVRKFRVSIKRLCVYYYSHLI